LNKKIEIVIPIFNDFESLEVLLTRIADVENEYLRFIIVDNGSTDTRITKLLEKTPHNCKSVRTVQNLGFGGGILFGVNQTESEWVGWMPGNLKVDPRELTNFIYGIEFNENYLVKASRSGRKLVAHLKTLFAGIVQSLLLRENMLDTGGTPTICTKKFILSLVNPPTSYVFESFILFIARQRKMEVLRPKIHYGVRLFGKSHWQNGLRAEWNLMRLIMREARHWR